MNYAVYGSKEQALTAKKVIEKMSPPHGQPSNKVVCFVDNADFHRIGDSNDNTAIVSIYKAKQLYDEKDVQGIVVPSSYPHTVFWDMVDFCRKVGFPDKDILTIPINVLRGAPADDNRLCTLDSLIQLYDVHWNIRIDCNLNCRGCTVCANITKTKGNYDLSLFQREIDRLHELVPDVFLISIMGGEPFMNPQVCDFVEYSRRVYPYANITVTTNGSYLFSTPEETFQRIRKAKANIKLSLYPPFYSRTDDFIGILKKYDMDFHIEPVYTFSKCLTKKPHTKPDTLTECRYFCKEVRDGYISRCVPAFYAYKLNARFETNLPEYEGIDLFDPSLTGKSLIKRLRDPLPLCAHCYLDEERLQFYTWIQSKNNNDEEKDYFWDI
ncbi:MAG: radical SAM protein [Selenomonadaceae bacterium]|nr:radical SAM protein [Selenomonadaceae bacterium]